MSEIKKNEKNIEKVLSEIYPSMNAELKNKVLNLILNENRVNYTRLFETLENKYSLKPDIEVKNDYMSKNSFGTSKLALVINRSKSVSINRYESLI